MALYLPESGCIHDSELKKMSENWGMYIESKQYFSWERFFTECLIEKTKGTYLQYNKKSINKAYLNEAISKQLTGVMKYLDFEDRNRE